jgi:hypothetical protein
MKLFALLLIAFVALLVTADAHDNKRVLQSGKPEGNAPARPATMPDDKKAQEEKKAREEMKAREEKKAREEMKAREEKKARDEKELKEQKNSTNSTTSKPPSLPTVVGDSNAKKSRDDKKAQEEKKARDKKKQELLQEWGGGLVGNSDPNANSRFATSIPSPDDR